MNASSKNRYLFNDIYNYTINLLPDSAVPKIDKYLGTTRSATNSLKP